MTAIGSRHPIVWSFLPSETIVDVVEDLSGRRLLIYHCLSDFAAVADDRDRLLRSERELARVADLVFALSPVLAARLQHVARDVEVMPTGVDLQLFTGGNRTPKSDAIPVIGYVGGLHPSFDSDLIAESARRRPEWRFEMVGPIQTAVRGSLALPNVKLVGRQPHAALPALIDSFDVCLIPYRRTDYTDSVVPTKLNEYLAMGKPVISTPIPAVVEFNDRHHVVRIVKNDPGDLVAAIEDELSGDGSGAAERRRRAAESYDWDGLLTRMLDRIEGVV